MITRGRRVRERDSLGVWNWHVHTAIFKIDNQQRPVVKKFFFNLGNFLGGSVVKNLSPNAGVVGLILGMGTKVPYATGQLSIGITTTEPAHLRAWAPKLKEPVYCKKDLA